jgi:hypothetical protein
MDRYSGTCFVALEDGKPVLRQADDHIRISEQFLADADPEQVKRDGDVLDLGGLVRYRIVGHDLMTSAYLADRVG